MADEQQLSDADKAAIAEICRTHRYANTGERYQWSSALYLAGKRAAIEECARADALTFDQIVAIRDECLPSQGEPFDCVLFARAILAAVGATRSLATRSESAE